MVGPDSVEGPGVGQKIRCLQTVTMVNPQSVQSDPPLLGGSLVYELVITMVGKYISAPFNRVVGTPPHGLHGLKIGVILPLTNNPGNLRSKLPVISRGP